MSFCNPTLLGFLPFVMHRKCNLFTKRHIWVYNRAQCQKKPENKKSKLQPDVTFR